MHDLLAEFYHDALHSLERQIREEKKRTENSEGGDKQEFFEDRASLVYFFWNSWLSRQFPCSICHSL